LPVLSTVNFVAGVYQALMASLGLISAILYKSMIRPHVEYANSVWNPFREGDIEDILKNLKRATKLVKSLKYLF